VHNINGKAAYVKLHYGNYVYIVWNSRNSNYDIVYQHSKIDSREYRVSSYRVLFKTNRLSSSRCILENRLKWRFVYLGSDKPADDLLISNGEEEPREKCGSLIRKDRYGKISMLGSPKYPKKSQCDWFFQPKCKSNIIQYKFTTLDIEKSSNCNYDYVLVGSSRYSYSFDMKRYCTNFRPRGTYRGYQISGKTNIWVDYSVRQSRGGGFPVTFISDDGAEKKGFVMEWRCKY
jgi:hypothetical protein